MVIAVGALFSNIFCVTKDSSGVTQKIVQVPLAYANKEKFVVRLQQDPDLREDIQVILPRMSYEIVGFDFDSSRQLNKINKVPSLKEGKSVYSYTPVPYKLTFNVYSFTRTSEDNFQIMEQILPYFTPDMNLSIKVMQNPDVIQNCDLTLNSVSTDDSYDGSFEDRKYIISTYSLSLSMNYYGPLFGRADLENHFQDGDVTNVIKKVSVNVNTNRYTAEINPFAATANDPYTVSESLTPRTPLTDFDQNQKL